MTTVSIDNPEVSIVLDNSSTTVPAGEVWKVTVTVNMPNATKFGTNFTRERDAVLRINGDRVANAAFVQAQEKRSNDASFASSLPATIVVVGGDTLEHAERGAMHIGGIVVNT
jgi:hypothetical protein